MKHASLPRLHGAVMVMAALASVLAVGAGAAACGGTAPPSPSPQASPMQLKVMEPNTEYGATSGFAKVVEAAQAADPGTPARARSLSRDAAQAARSQLPE